MKSVEEQLFESGQFYAENYEKSIFEFTGNRSQYIQDKSEKCKCRFCGKESPNVTFRKTAHAISRFLGNTVWLLKNECDLCNENIFSPMEDDLAKYLQFSLNISGVSGRRGVPTIKNEATGFRMEHIHHGNMQIKCCHNDMLVDKARKSITINPNMPVQKYTPINVIKAFVKSICSVLDENELKKCSSTIKWLQSNTNVINQYPVLHTFVPGPKPFNGGRLILLKRKTNISLPYIWGIFEFGNFRYQIMLPFCDEDKFWQQSDVENSFNCFFYPVNTDSEYHKIYGHPRFYIKDMSCHEKVSEKCNSMSFCFSEIKPIPIDNMAISSSSLISSDITKDPLSLLPLYRLSAVFLITSNGSEKEYSDFLGSYVNERQCFEITSYKFPIHFKMSVDKNNSTISFTLKDEVWQGVDVKNIFGFEFIEDLFYATNVICKIYVDGFQYTPLELPFSPQFIEKWKDTWSNFILYRDTIKILQISSTYDDYKECFNQLDFTALRDFVLFYKNKTMAVESINFIIPSTPNISENDDQEIEFLATRLFMLNKKCIQFKVLFRFKGIKIVESFNNSEEELYRVESSSPVDAEFIDYTICDGKD